MIGIVRDDAVAKYLVIHIGYGRFPDTNCHKKDSCYFIIYIQLQLQGYFFGGTERHHMYSISMCTFLFFVVVSFVVLVVVAAVAVVVALFTC